MSSDKLSELNKKSLDEYFLDYILEKYDQNLTKNEK